MVVKRLSKADSGQVELISGNKKQAQKVYAADEVRVTERAGGSTPCDRSPESQ